MIRSIEKEYREGDLAVRETVVSFFYIPIYKYRKESTNNQAVKQLTIQRNNKTKIKGFNK